MKGTHGPNQTTSLKVADPTSLALHGAEYVARYAQKPLDRVQKLAERIASQRQSSVADFGCGNGMLLHALGERYGTYDGIDFSPEFIAAANSWAERESKHRYRFHLTDIRDFCADRAGTFDIATTLDFSEHVDDELAVEIYSAIRNVLKPGGTLYLHTPNLNFFIERAKQFGILRQFPEHIAVRNSAQTVAILRRAGFAGRAIRVQEIAHYNSLRHLHALRLLPGIGRLFAARLWIEAGA